MGWGRRCSVADHHAARDQRDLRGTLLTEDHLELRTLMTRRLIPWDQVTGIEEKVHRTRTGPWYTARVRRSNGRPLRVPGFAGGLLNWESLDEYLMTVREYWTRRQLAAEKEIAGRNGR
jgi:hypothetical protein